MRIEKVLNNNVIVFLDAEGHETIAMGRGIAFKKRPGDQVDESLVNKIFTANPRMNNVERLIAEIPSIYFDVGEDIYQYAKLKLQKSLNPNMYLFLVDHIYGACTRAKDGIHLKNPMLWDTKRFYPDEYEVAVFGLQTIKERIGISLAMDEAGFIALNIVNSSLEASGDAMEITKIMQEVTNIIKRQFMVELDENSVYFYRFISHLKYFATRLVKKEVYASDDDDLFHVIKKKYKNAYHCTEVIDKFVQNKYGYDLSNEEKLYLTIHIERMIYRTGES